MIDRSPYLVGNWKMHKGAKESREFFRQLLGSPPTLSPALSHIWIAPPFTSIASAVESTRGSAIHIGAQNVSEHEEGAHTGEISLSMLWESGVTFVIVGHSERRNEFHEDSLVVHRKVIRALKGGMRVILCIGEQEEDYTQGKTWEVLSQQLNTGLGSLSYEVVKELLLIAYEPVWAIGSGQVATPDLVEGIHQRCRAFLQKKWGKPSALIPMLYGGSVGPHNLRSLLSQPHVDGVLIGGASLVVESFKKMIQSANEGGG